MSEAPVAAIVGAGSLFTVELLQAVVASPDLRGMEIRLADIDADRLELVARYGRRLMEEHGCPCPVSAHRELDSALRGARFVVATVAVGGEAMRELDVQVPLRHGVAHVKGDTTGPAGIFRALRGIPFMVDLCRRMEKLCPGAMLINLTNPLTMLTRAALRESTVTALGICSCIDDMRQDIAGKMCLDPDRLRIDCIGVNHFTWMQRISFDGRDATQLFVERAIPLFLRDLPVTSELYTMFGRFPIPGFKYASEFFPWYLGPDTRYGRDLGFQPEGSAARRARAEGALAALAQQVQSPHRLPAAVASTLAQVTKQTMTSVAFNTAAVLNIDVPNQGRVPSLPAEAVLEGPAHVSGESIRPLCCGELPEAIQQILVRIVSEQELVVEAAVRGDRGSLLEAFLMDPLVPSPLAARRIIDELLVAEKGFLPQF